MSATQRFIPLLGLLIVVAVGCSRLESVDVSYGVSRGRVGKTSVNGTGGLDHYFREAGYVTMATRRLSARLDRLDTVVWFPGAGVPSDAAIDFFDRWLADSAGRTLVLVNPGYDAQLDYWRHAAQRTTDAQQALALQWRDATSILGRIQQHAKQPDTESCEWYEVRHERVLPQWCDTLRGAWANQIDATRSRFRWVDRVVFPQLDSNFERTTLLAHGDIPLVTRLGHTDWPHGQVLIVTHSQWLVNLGLSNPEHRRLAQHLVATCRAAQGESPRMAFVETDDAQVTPNEESPPRTVGSMFFLWPISAPLWHCFVWGLFLCAAYFPQLGRPRSAPITSLVDFGRHIEALGQLLAATQDVEYARQRVAEYHKLTSLDTPSPIASQARKR